MIDKNIFMETVRLVADMVRSSDRPLSYEEIVSCFKDMDLSNTQQEMIFQYLQQMSKDAEIPLEKVGKDTEKRTSDKLPKTAYFKMYLEDIHKIKLCTQQEEENLFGKLIAGDKTVLHRLSEQWLIRVLKLAEKYEVSTEELPDLIQEGNMGVFLTLEELAGSGEKVDYMQVLTDAANAAMEGYLQDFDRSKEMEQSILVKTSLVYEARKYLTEEFQRIPTMTELSQYTKIPVEELEDILTMSKQ